MTKCCGFIAFAAFSTALTATATFAQHSATTPVGPDELAFSIENMKPVVDPAEDFYAYAVGAWMDRVQRPAKDASFGIFTVTRDKVTQQLGVILPDAADAASDVPKGSPTQLVGDFYSAYMDTDAIDAAGIEPIRDELDRIDAIQTMEDLVAFMGHQPEIDGVSMLLIMGHSVDPADSTRYAMFVTSPSFGIQRQFEDILNEPEDGPRKSAYRTYLAEMLMVAGYDPAEAKRVAGLSVEIESTLHAGKLTPVEGADPRAHYNPMSLADVQAQIPQLDLSALLEQSGYPPVDQVILYEPRYLPALSELLESRPLDEIKDYARLRMVLEFSNVMSTEFEGPNERLGEALLGIAYTAPRAERAANLLANTMAHPLGQVYLAAALDDGTRATAEDMIDRIEAAFIARLPSRDWLSEETRAQALAKAEAVTADVGGPEDWIDFSGVDIGPDPVANRMAVAAFLQDRSLAQWGKPVEHEGFNEEATWPTTVNAAYTPSVNGFEVPAAILQPPFFQAELDAPVYFCRLGGIIGHELTHGFDSGGRQYDAAGNLRDWWQPEDATRFIAEAQKLVDQANAYEVLPGLMANGALNVRENMADVGGITLAHQALRGYLEEHPEENVEIDGLTPDQRCFIAWAQMWASKDTDQYLRIIVASNGHPPTPYRSVAPLQHVPAFYEAFDIQEGDPMWLPPDRRVNAW